VDQHTKMQMPSANADLLPLFCPYRLLTYPLAINKILYIRY